jgi:N-acyl-D-amino-acid deacylase
MTRTLIKNGQVMDGAGGLAVSNDVLIEDDSIAELGKLDNVSADNVIDASGKVVSPGFIDMHSHADMLLPVAPYAESAVFQGITTAVVGQCGASPAPLSEVHRKLFIDSSGIPVEYPWDEITSFGSYLDLLEKQGISINVAPLVGHGAIRIAVMGYRSDRPTEDEIEAMQMLVTQSMDEGAIGLSTGLIYPPGYYSTTQELIEITRPVGERRGFYFSHVRGEGATLLDSIREEEAIARATGVAVQHSHYKAAGEENWDKSAQGLELIDRIHRDGIDMTVDMYPYVASSNGLIDALPDWSREGGIEMTMQRLRDPADRKRIRDSMSEQRWEKNLISGSPNKDYVGHYVAELAEQAGKDPYEWVFDALLETRGQMDRIVFGMSEDNVRVQLQYEGMMIGTDGYGVPPSGPLSEGAPHPRSFGTFPRVLGKYVREENVLTLEKAIWKMTGFPAKKLRLKDRGLVKKGYKADLVVFDPATIIDQATFVKPQQYPSGIDAVIVNGKIVIQNGQHTHVTAGRVISRQ